MKIYFGAPATSKAMRRAFLTVRVGDYLAKVREFSGTAASGCFARFVMVLDSVLTCCRSHKVPSFLVYANQTPRRGPEILNVQRNKAAVTERATKPSKN